MRPLLYILSFAILIGLGFWAYEENYQTKEIVNQAERMQNDIAHARARLGVLRAEWAYLNRPDRLRELAELNFDPLALLPITPDQFGRMDQVDYPAAEVPEVDVNAPIEVSTMNMQEVSFLQEDRP